MSASSEDRSDSKPKEEKPQKPCGCDERSLCSLHAGVRGGIRIRLIDDFVFESLQGFDPSG